MIRPLLVVKRSNDIDPLKNPLVEEAVAAFVSYLRTYYTEKSKDSKHGKMGPVGKLLSRMRSGKMGEQVLGEAVRIHEMTAKPAPNQKNASITTEQLNALSTGVMNLTSLLSDPSLSLSEHKRVLDAVGAMIYFRLEKANKDFLAAGQEKFRSFLQAKYSTVEQLRIEWDDPKMDWTRVPFPSLKNKNERVCADVKEYLSQTNATESEIEPTEEEIDA